MRHRKEHFRINKFARRYNRKTGKFTFNISYETKTDITDRTVEVAEAFGLGISDYQKHVLYDDVELKIGPKDIVYLTGDSGSGKSVLLNAIVADLKPQEAVRLSDVKIDAEKQAAELDYQQALILAMKKEKAAFKLYHDLAAKVEDDSIKDLFLGLAQEEAKHKLRFEIEYDEVILKDN